MFNEKLKSNHAHNSKIKSKTNSKSKLPRSACWLLAMISQLPAHPSNLCFVAWGHSLPLPATPCEAQPIGQTDQRMGVGRGICVPEFLSASPFNWSSPQEQQPVPVAIVCRFANSPTTSLITNPPALETPVWAGSTHRRVLHPALGATSSSWDTCPIGQHFLLRGLTPAMRSMWGHLQPLPFAPAALGLVAVACS